MKLRLVVGVLCSVLVWGVVSLAEESVLSISLGWGGLPQQLEGALQRYTERTGVQFELATPGGGPDPYHEALFVRFASGIAPDLVLVEGHRLEQFVVANLLLPLDAFYERDVDFSEFFVDMFDASRVNGVLYGFPLVGGGYRVNAFYVNRDIFNRAGIPVPSPNIEDALSYDELLSLARRLTLDPTGDGKPDQWGIKFPVDWNGWTAWLPGNGARVFNEDKTEVLLDRPEAVEVFQLLQDFNYTYSVRGGEFYRGNVAMELGIRANQQGHRRRIGDSFDWSVAPVAKGRAGSVGVLNMNSIAINATSDKAEEAWRFIQFLMSEEEQDLRAAEGVAVARRSSALRYQMLDEPPYDLTPFLFGPTVNRETMTMPSGAVWPTEADDYINEIIEGKLSPLNGAIGAADVLRHAISGN